MRIRLLSATSRSPLTILLLHIYLLYLLDLARWRNARLLKLGADFGFGGRKLSLCPEVLEVAVYMNVIARRVSVDSLRGVVFFLRGVSESLK